ncbi:Na+/H+ antiporter NhaC family protein [Sporohalobacter salinus]|uniref:Na+/H+ antiporter NhaC family protein n=1 Tax=Sporohalobacter salinus TaxID=1494606 RepID=UPI00196023B0|nr:Na+/H+ antiporter NhaC family protein [Sporohalobacter salinus]MBM7624094.1 Na+/H+ antiporter NhaC [Sporohalobacter salinus]
MDNNQKQERPLALLPLLVFLGLFMGTGLYLNYQGVEMAFYKLPAPIAAGIGVIVAFIITRGSLDDKMNSFIEGAGESSIVTMCMIYLLAGALAAVAKSIGGVDSTVNLGLSLIPSRFIIPGLFIIAGFIATAMGTSMGTVGAVVPIAVGMADKTSLPLALTVGAVVGGAMFGDNLSMISDTTIAATQTQGCKMRDKFKANFSLVLPAAILTLIILFFMGQGGSLAGSYPYELIKVVPYLLVLILALAGLNVFVVLTIGILLAGGIGIVGGELELLEFASTAYDGFTSMQSIFFLSMLIGGLAEMIREDGGIDYLLNSIRSKVKSKRGAKLGIGALVSVADICTANNTVAIILAGPMAKEIAEEHKIKPKNSASILDIFSCVWQGLIPYSAQLLLAGSLAKISPLKILPYLYYQFILGAVILGVIIFGDKLFSTEDNEVESTA